MENTKVFAEMTNAEKFGAIMLLDGVTDEMREFLNKQIENLKKKNSYKSKADKVKDAENEKIEQLICDSVDEHPISTAEIAIMIGASLGKYISTQRITPRCKHLVSVNRIECVVEKGVNKYKAV